MTSETILRRDAREKVAALARQGRAPSEISEPDDLQWAFGRGHEDEIAELEQIAEQAKTAKRDQLARTQLALELNAATDSVLREWDAREQLERRERAKVEARRRLGLDEDA